MFGLEAPVRPVGRIARAEKLSMAEREAKRTERAKARFLAVQTVSRFAAGLSASKQLDTWISTNPTQLFAGAMPLSRTGLRNLLAKHPGGAMKLDQFRDRPRSGRPKLLAHPRLAQIIEDAALTGHPNSIRRVHAVVAKTAATLNLAIPSYGTVKAWYAGVDTVARSAARHGAAAAEIDSLPHSTVPAPFTHDVWTLDEFELPVWVRLYRPQDKTWVSFKPAVVLVMDNCSRAILSLWVCDPTRRTGRQSTEWQFGADQVDILGALVAAACPEVATPACRSYSGYLPTTLRWDRAKAHEALRPKLESVGVSVPTLPGNRPINRGIVERLIGTLKARCDVLVGSSEAFLPTDQGKLEEEEALQAKLAGTQLRARTRTAIEPEYLPSVAEVREQLDTIVGEYNEDHEHSALEEHAPGDVYRMQMRRMAERRPGRDIVSLIDPKVTLVSNAGVIHREGRRTYSFAFSADGIMLTVGKPVTYRPDPLLRGLFAEVGGRSMFLKPLSQWAAEQKPAQVAAQQRAAATVAATQAAESRKRAEAIALGNAIQDRAAGLGVSNSSDATGESDGSEAELGEMISSEEVTEELLSQADLSEDGFASLDRVSLQRSVPKATRTTKRSGTAQRAADISSTDAIRGDGK